MKRQNKPRLLFVNYEFPLLGGGGGVAAKNLAVGCIKNGYRVDYVTTRFAKQRGEEYIQGIHLHRVHVLGRTHRETASLISLLWFPISAYEKGRQLCQAHTYTGIISHFAIPSGIVGTMLSRTFHIPHVLTIIGRDIYDPTHPLSPHKTPMLHALVRSILCQADHVVAISHDIRSRAITYFHPTKDIRVIPIPYSLRTTKVRCTRKKLGLIPSQHYLITICRLIKRKGLHVLIQALALLHDSNIDILVIGSGPEKSRLLELAKKLRVFERIHFIGYVSEKKKQEYLHCADTFVLPSIHEGFGIVIQEAMEAGLPIVTTNQGGQIDVVVHNKNGLLIPPNDPRKLAHAILTLATNMAFRKKCVLNNRIQILKYQDTAIAQQYLEMLA